MFPQDLLVTNCNHASSIKRHDERNDDETKHAVKQKTTSNKRRIPTSNLLSICWTDCAISLKDRIHYKPTFVISCRSWLLSCSLALLHQQLQHHHHAEQLHTRRHPNSIPSHNRRQLRRLPPSPLPLPRRTVPLHSRTQIRKE